ncbi:CrcB family protein [Terribacillus sp. AE2B 122]|jgi:fluoride exporter|uniref:fluoride efflux transporter FluC n=1 Tax=Terribacillus sp. AE2B 122 TaxID=1331902 RepID=UPI001440B6E9|nr:CrcB family protein [Terribacillus sp. AE2B 122]VVM34871.1 camphor resistance protein CrcB [Terribacillus sp. AE2B 122]
MSLIFVLVGGWLGAISRYEISRRVETFWRNDFPLATFLINITGSFLIGLVFQADWGTGWHNFLAVGFLGSFTTFSTFHLEIVHLGSRSKIALASCYLFSSYFIGILLALLAISM